MPVAVSCRTPAGAPWRTYLGARARQILRALALARCELSLSVVADSEMRALNRAYRGHDQPTDVLAFALGEDVDPYSESAGLVHAACARPRLATGVGPRRQSADVVLGDVVISIDTAAEQARLRRCALATRLDVLLVHGILHLIGYDHEISGAEERRMARRARQVQTALGASIRPAGGAGAGRRRSTKRAHRRMPARSATGE